MRSYWMTLDCVGSLGLALIPNSYALPTFRGDSLVHLISANVVLTSLRKNTSSDSDVFFFYCYGVHRDLHSFPTRRSSDLDRPFEITESTNPRHLQLRTYSEIWHKENALNLLINRLPPEARYICWADADLFWTNNRWCQDTIDRKSTRLNSSHRTISYAVFC